MKHFGLNFTQFIKSHITSSPIEKYNHNRIINKQLPTTPSFHSKFKHIFVQYI